MTNLSPAKRKKALNFPGISRDKTIDDKLVKTLNDKQIKDIIRKVLTMLI